VGPAISTAGPAANSYYRHDDTEGRQLRCASKACALGSYFCSGNTWTRFEDSRSVRPADVREYAPRTSRAPDSGRTVRAIATQGGSRIR